MDTKELEDIINKIEEKGKIIRKERHELRELFYKFILAPDFLDNGAAYELEVGLADIGSGLFEIENSVTTLRDYLEKKK